MLSLIALGEEKGHLKTLYTKHKIINIKKALSLIVKEKSESEVKSEVYRIINDDYQEIEITNEVRDKIE